MSRQSSGGGGCLVPILLFSLVAMGMGWCGPTARAPLQPAPGNSFVPYDPDAGATHTASVAVTASEWRTRS